MAKDTILVIDADQEIDQRIVSTLDAEGYLVFSAVSHLVTDEMADRLKPSLIYIKPLSPNAEGFRACRMIHTVPKLKNVPIVLLATLKGPLQPQHTEYYGIIDSLRLNFTSEELITKTVSILAAATGPLEPEPAGVGAYQPVEEEASPEESPTDEEPIVLSEPLEEQDATPDESPDAWPAEEEKSPWEDEVQEPSAPRQPLPGRTYRKGRVQRPSLLPWLIGLLIIVALGGAGFYAYQHFMPGQREKPVVSRQSNVTAPLPVPEPVAPPAPIAPIASPEPTAVPAQTPEPAPLSGKPAPELTTPSYAVQVGAFKTEETAAILVKKLQGRGYEAYAQKGVTKDNSPIIRVLIGNFTDRKAALKLSGEIHKKEQISTTIFTN